MNQMKIEKAQVAQRFAKAGASYTEHAIVQQQICQSLFKLMQQQLSDIPLDRVFEIGCGTGNLTQLMLRNLPIKQLILNDLYPEVQQHFSPQQAIEWQIGDIEQIEYPTALDLIVSSSALQWMTDLDAVFKKCRAALKSQGYFCFSSFGQQNLKQIKMLTGQGLDYLSIETLQEKLLTQSFEVLHLSQSIENLNFAHPKQVLQHLQATGVTATASKHRWSKQSLQQFYLDYEQFSSLDSCGQRVYSLSYHPIYCIARRTV